MGDLINSGSVYKLCLHEDDKVYYIGSTKRDIKYRLYEHKYDILHERFNKEKTKFFKDKIKDLKILVLAVYENITWDELKRKERFFFDNTRKCLNEICPIREKGEIKRIWFQLNKLKIYKYRNQKIKCDLCDKHLSRRYMYIHKKLIH